MFAESQPDSIFFENLSWLPMVNLPKQKWHLDILRVCGEMREPGGRKDTKV